MNIQNVIVHKLIKDQHKKGATTQPGDAVLVVTASVIKLVDAIFKMYSGKTNKGYGRFEADEINYPVAKQLRESIIKAQVSFYDMSVSLLERLRIHAGEAVMATGGFVLMAQVRVDHKDYFIVAIITNVGGSVIDENTLEVKDVEHIDFSNLRIAGRVNLTDWQSDDTKVRYLGFLKQRGDFTDYFKKFLGCNDVLESLNETKKLVAAVQNFADEKQLTGEIREGFFSLVHSYLTECADQKMPLSLGALANRAWPETPEDLRTKFTEQNTQVSDGFVPDKRASKGLVNLKFSNKFWSIDLNRNALNRGYAEYHPDLGGLLLKQLPPGLEEELRNMQDDDE